MIFKKIWNDPVWSKVIAGVILSVLTLLFSGINSTSITNIWFIILIIGVLLIFICFIKYPYWYDNETREADRRLFNTMIEQLSEGIDFIREHDLGGSFSTAYLQKLYYFEYIKKNPNYNFLNPKIEKLKKELIQQIIAFKEITLTNTFPINGDIVRIPAEWRDEKPEFYNKIRQSIHAAADNVCKSYDKFINKGKKILKI